MKGKNILIVDDEPLQTRIFKKLVSDMGHNAIIINNGQDAINYFLNREVVESVPSYEVDIMLLDLSMPRVDGIKVLKEINGIKGKLQIIVLTANNDISQVVKATSLGAEDYILKVSENNKQDDVHARLFASINNLIEKQSLQNQICSLERSQDNQASFSDVIAGCDQMKEVINLAKKVVNSTAPVLIIGSAGVGKEFLARVIHGSSKFSGRRFIMVNCTHLKEEEADNILFGYEKFTEDGSIIKDKGIIRNADGGTIFLDNIDELNLSSQRKLLHFTQDSRVEPVGSTECYKVNTRIISATTEDLKEIVKKGSFREDLYYRLNVFPIVIPSLKERGTKEIKLLAETFCHNFSVSENKKITKFSNSAMKLLTEYSWERGVRQLKNYIFRAIILCDRDTIEPKHFPQIIGFSKKKQLQSNLNREGVSEYTDNNKINNDGISINLLDSKGVYKTLNRIEGEIINFYVNKCNGNLSEAAKILSIGRSTIYRRLKLISD